MPRSNSPSVSTFGMFGAIGVLAGLTGVAMTTFAVSARANGFEIPENGTELMGRAGAWTARADNPLAAAYNPAGLAGQPTALLINSNFTWQSFCFQRAGSYGATNDVGTVFAGSSYAGQPYPEVCKENALKDVNVVPQLAFAYHVTDRLGLAFAIVTPSAAGKATWPDRVTLSDGSAAPAPQRFLLLSQEAIVISPTLAAGYEIARGIRVGAAFQAVVSFLKFSNISQAKSGSAKDAAESPNIDLKGDLSVKKPFTPAVVLGALVSPTDDFDIGLMFRWGADVKMNGGDVTIAGPYYGDRSSARNTPAITNGQVGEFSIPQPIDLRLGLRYHPLRKGVTFEGGGRRDFLANDAFDIEVDGTYSHNAVFSDLRLLFPEGQSVALGNLTTAGLIPPDASVPHRWKDNFGVRIGGEYVAIPDRLGIRAGGFGQSNGQDPAYLGIDFLPSAMFGLYVGGTLRVSKSVDLSTGFGHIFLSGLDNGGVGQVRALNAQERWDPAVCSSNPPPYRGCDPVNGGKVTGNYTMFSLGATIRL